MPMSPAISSPPRWRPLRFLTAALALSLVGHAAALAFLHGRRTEVVSLPKPVEVELVEVKRPEPPPAPPPEPEPPRPPPPKPMKRPPVKVAEVSRPTPPPETPAPPPPNQPPAPEPAKPAPLVVGISMSSTTSAGSFAAPVGNTTYGKTEERASAPEEVKSYSAPRYVPIYQVDSEPELLHEEKVPVPEEARRAGVEGTVLLSITVDPEGKVVKAKVLRGPGYGMNEAALGAIRRFKFKPATKGGEPVSTEMNYSYTFVLD